MCIVVSVYRRSETDDADGGALGTVSGARRRARAGLAGAGLPPAGPLPLNVRSGPPRPVDNSTIRVRGHCTTDTRPSHGGLYSYRRASLRKVVRD